MCGDHPLLGGSQRALIQNRQASISQQLDGTQLSILTLLMNAEATFIQSTRMQRFLKTFKPCQVGIHWIALAEFFQMNTHLPGFRSFSTYFASFCIDQISHQQHNIRVSSPERYNLPCKGFGLSRHQLLLTLMLLVANLANAR